MLIPAKNTIFLLTLGFSNNFAYPNDLPEIKVMIKARISTNLTTFSSKNVSASNKLLVVLIPLAPYFRQHNWWKRPPHTSVGILRGQTSLAAL